MQKYVRNRAKEDSRNALQEAGWKKPQTFFEDGYGDLAGIPYKGCNCSDCVSMRRNQQSIRSRIKNSNKTSIQVLGDIFIRSMFR